MQHKVSILPILLRHVSNADGLSIRWDVYWHLAKTFLLIAVSSPSRNVRISAWVEGRPANDRRLLFSEGGHSPTRWQRPFCRRGALRHSPSFNFRRASALPWLNFFM